MDLLGFFRLEGGSGRPNCQVLTRMAVRIGLSPRTLYLIARGHKLAGPRLCARVEAYTRGAVRREDLRPEIFTSTFAPPDGWVLMPRVLTEEMLQAGYPADTAQEGYEAMIAARPEVKP